jgi:hypothetical protein
MKTKRSIVRAVHSRYCYAHSGPCQLYGNNGMDPDLKTYWLVSWLGGWSCGLRHKLVSQLIVVPAAPAQAS